VFKTPTKLQQIFIDIVRAIAIGVLHPILRIFETRLKRRPIILRYLYNIYSCVARTTPPVAREAMVGVRGVENVLSDLSERLLGHLGHSLGHVLSESVSQ
jgi:hypothetical protein